MSKEHGPFVWYELITTDPAAAGAFYSALAGWRLSDAGMPGMDYTIASTGGPGTGVAGLMPRPPELADRGIPPHWMGYVAVADVDATVAEAEAMGGRLIDPPMDIPEVGRMAVIADPQGAAIALIAPLSDERWSDSVLTTPGHFGWHELYAVDAGAVLPFYARLFGWQADATMDMGAMGLYRTFSHGGRMIGGMMDKRDDMPMPAWGFYITVEAMDAALARAQAAGATLLNGPHQVTDGPWIAQLTDPQGAYVAVMAPVR